MAAVSSRWNSAVHSTSGPPQSRQDNAPDGVLDEGPMDSMVTVSCLDCSASVEVPTTPDRAALDELLDDYGWQPVKGGDAYCPLHRHPR